MNNKKNSYKNLSVFLAILSLWQGAEAGKQILKNETPYEQNKKIMDKSKKRIKKINKTGKEYLKKKLRNFSSQESTTADSGYSSPDPLRDHKDLETDAIMISEEDSAPRIPIHNLPIYKDSEKMWAKFDKDAEIDYPDSPSSNNIRFGKKSKDFENYDFTAAVKQYNVSNKTNKK